MGILLPVLGLTWSIGVFAVDTLSLPLAYAFTILNSLQVWRFKMILTLILRVLGIRVSSYSSSTVY